MPAPAPTARVLLRGNALAMVELGGVAGCGAWCGGKRGEGQVEEGAEDRESRCKVDGAEVPGTTEVGSWRGDVCAEDVFEGLR